MQLRTAREEVLLECGEGKGRRSDGTESVSGTRVHVEACGFLHRQWEPLKVFEQENGKV